VGEAQVAASQPAGLRYSSARGRWVLLATVLGSAMASIDATVVGIALPAIGRDFHSSLATLQWVVTAYTLTLAGLLLFAGALGDKYGRKRVFIWGVAWFAVASALCGIAPDAPVLIAARAVQGVGAALLTPGSLAIIEASFAPEDRGKAIGAWSSPPSGPRSARRSARSGRVWPARRRRCRPAQSRPGPWTPARAGVRPR
jgi:predicted MFS family arabinose efflux permease